MKRLRIDATVRGVDVELAAVMTVVDKKDSVSDFDKFSNALNDALSEAFRKVSFEYLGVPKDKEYIFNGEKHSNKNNYANGGKDKKKIYDEATIKKELLEMVDKKEEELTKKQSKLFKKATKELLEKIDVGMPMPLAVLTSEFPFEFNNACK